MQSLRMSTPNEQFLSCRAYGHRRSDHGRTEVHDGVEKNLNTHDPIPSDLATRITPRTADRSFLLSGRSPPLLATSAGRRRHLGRTRWNCGPCYALPEKRKKRSDDQAVPQLSESPTGAGKRLRRLLRTVARKG